MAEMADNGARSESTTFRYIAQNVINLRGDELSPPCYIRNLPWKIMAMSRRGPTTDRDQQRYLGFFLQCNGESESLSWSCYATAELRLISHKPGIAPFTRKIQHLFYSKENDWGFTHFLPWGDVLDPEKGYVKDNTITLEVHVTPHEPHGISGVSKKRTGTVEGEEETCDFKKNGFHDEDDEARSQAKTFRFIVPKVKEMKMGYVLSPPCYIHNLPWRIMAMPRKAPIPGRPHQRALGFFLQCNGDSESPTWSCYAKAELSLISHNPNTATLTRKVQHLFHSKENDWGFSLFTPWEDVVDPEKGFLQNDTITLEVVVTAYEPHGLSSDSENDTDAGVGGYKIGKLMNEGKTKQVYELDDHKDLCLLLYKDEATAAGEAHGLEGKAAISNQTNAKVFDILKSAEIKTYFVKIVSPTAFISKKCKMVPIKWVTRRVATGSFLKRNPAVSEGFRFSPPKLETFFKDNANHDTLWSEEQMVCAKWTINGLAIGKDEVEYMRRATILVFEILEKAWALRDCALVDMKIKFGVDHDGNILLADAIDFDSWTLWPSGDKRLTVNKQMYRNLTRVTAAYLNTVKRYSWIKDQLDFLKPTIHHKVVVFMGSPDDEEYCQNIARAARELGLDVDVRVTSTDTATEETLRIMQQYEDTRGALVFIVVAGRSSGLGPVLSGNTSYPVINCAPPSETVQVCPGLGCATVSPDSAALMAAQIIGLQDYIVWARLRSKQLDMAASLIQADDRISTFSSNKCLLGGYLYSVAF